MNDGHHSLDHERRTLDDAAWLDELLSLSVSLAIALRMAGENVIFGRAARSCSRALRV